MYPITVRRGKKQVDVEVTGDMSIDELEQKLRHKDTSDKRKSSGNKTKKLGEQHKLFVGGLSCDTTDDKLWETFSKVWSCASSLLDLA